MLTRHLKRRCQIHSNKCCANAAFYAKNADLVGELRAKVEATKHTAKVEAQLVYLDAKGTVAERTAKADTSAVVLAAWEEHHNAVADYATLQTQLKAAELRIEVWRSQSANQRRGNI